VRTNPAVAVIGAGIGGLTAALTLAARGVEVVVFERAAAPGGKMRELTVGGVPIDSGPTVFTMRWIFEEIFDAVNASFDELVAAQPVEVLARHAWDTEQRLDLFADRQRSADAIGRFAGAAEGRRYLQFCEQSRRIFETLDAPFIRAQRPNPVSLVQRTAAAGLGGLRNIKPFTSMWSALRSQFRDARLQQLFGRYATYCGSSPYLAPATLMLVAHVEQEGVWILRDGMHRLAAALRQLAEAHGAVFRFGAEVSDITVAGGRVSAVTDGAGERLACAAVVCNADVAALAGGRFGEAARRAVAAARPADRSLSALTWSMRAGTSGFPLLHHNVFFSRDYQREFADIFRHGRLPGEPTVYVCAQDRGDTDGAPALPAERLFCLVNAPAKGDRHRFELEEIEQCATRTFAVLERCGLRVQHDPGNTVVTTPSDFERLFPATGGALYGQASHGWRASFSRPGSRSRIPGLYLAGGSTHPGPGVPMAAMSGRLAAQSLLSDLASTGRSRRAAMPGGTSTR
jgi:1-hydroxycarotenoid 3,4-desaturase